VIDAHGDLTASAGTGDGLFYRDTRFLSLLEMRVNGMQPRLLGTSPRDDMRF
jgi:glycogen debranching enzyme